MLNLLMQLALQALERLRAPRALGALLLILVVIAMNALVGAATALVMWSTGVGDPILLGTVAFILNYVPILGPAAAILIFLFAGSLTVTSTWQALFPAALYGAIHVIEGETVTPMLLARRSTLNPVLVVFSFVFWFWLWGVPGAILSAPILATTKIACDRIRPLAALGHIPELGVERVSNAGDDLILQLEEIGHWLFEPLSPKMAAALRVDELHVDTHPIAAALDASLENVAHVQLASDIRYVEGLAFEGVCGVARDDECA